MISSGTGWLLAVIISLVSFARSRLDDLTHFHFFFFFDVLWFYKSYADNSFHYKYDARPNMVYLRFFSNIFDNVLNETVFITNNSLNWERYNRLDDSLERNRNKKRLRERFRAIILRDLVIFDVKGDLIENRIGIGKIDFTIWRA